ncbi:MAG: hypothetical protein VYE64_09785, partial [Planctomycetota bacterium]|nr:hypothetical protein [Planctomycetota bacterium]
MNNKFPGFNLNFARAGQTLTMLQQGRHPFGFVVLATALLVGLVGCGNIIPRGQSPDESLIAMDGESKETIYIGDICKVLGLNYAPVEGIGLVYSLDGTGSNPAPSG